MRGLNGIQFCCTCIYPSKNDFDYLVLQFLFPDLQKKIQNCKRNWTKTKTAASEKHLIKSNEISLRTASSEPIDRGFEFETKRKLLSLLAINYARPPLAAIKLGVSKRSPRVNVRVDAREGVCCGPRSAGVTRGWCERTKGKIALRERLLSLVKGGWW